MEYVWMLIVGLIAGVIARFLMPGKDPMGWIMTIVLGIAGSFLGGFLGGMLFETGGGPAGLIGSVIGAMILLLIYRMAVGRKTV